MSNQTGSMDRRYWERAALQHEEQIFDVFDNDSQQVIATALRRYASKKKKAADIGCAIGKWLPLLSELFSEVIAVDIAANYLAQAEASYGTLQNIRFKLGDIASMSPLECDLLLCVNSLLTPDPLLREAFLKTLSASIHAGGHLLLVIPSLESAMFTEFIFRYWHHRDREAVSEPSAADAPALLQQWQRGIVPLDSVPTKHFLKEELAFLLPQFQLEPVDIIKVEYSWQTELEAPPDWLDQPRPWDWLVIAQRN